MGVLLHLAHPFILGRPQGTQLFGHNAIWGNALEDASLLINYW